jgi:predicted transcriptional regulator
MKRSKLETNIAILKTIANQGKTIPTHITYETCLNHMCVTSSLSFLMDNKLVQEHNVKKRKEYSITDLGLKAMIIAKKINAVLPIFNDLYS